MGLGAGVGTSGIRGLAGSVGVNRRRADHRWSRGRKAWAHLRGALGDVSLERKTRVEVEVDVDVFLDFHGQKAAAEQVRQIAKGRGG